MRADFEPAGVQSRKSEKNFTLFDSIFCGAAIECFVLRRRRGIPSSCGFPGDPPSFAHFFSRERPLFVFRKVPLGYSEHLAHIRPDICSVVAVAFEQIALEFVLGLNGIL